MKQKKEEILLADAQKALRFDAKIRVGGGYKLTHNPSSYGIALKWLIKVRGLTYSKFASAYNGTTGQNLNHMINRVDKSRFFEEDVEKMCAILKISVEYFTGLCDKIEIMMEK